MNNAARLWTVLLLTLGACAVSGSNPPDPEWTLSIRDLNHREMVVAKVKFSEEAADSCIGGSWKRLIVESHETKDAHFFPITDPLSYMIEGAELIIGRNGTCDAYLRLRGKFDGVTAEGAYYVFGLRGGKDLGEFQITRAGRK